MKGEKLLTRYSKIKKLVFENGTVSIDTLVDTLGVSRMTILRDIEHLETRGFLRKVRNGATALPSSKFESSISFRLESAVLEKKRLAKAALKIISPGEAVILDEATTLLPMIEGLIAMGDVTIVTNFQNIIDKLHTIDVENVVRLIALGGEYIPQFATYSGTVCKASLSCIKADAYFTSVSAVSGGYAYHPHSLIAETKQSMMAAAHRRYLLIDHDKLGKTALHQVAELNAFDAIIVDKIPDPAFWPESLREKTIVAS